ncbi:lytic transglycosylase domain-containing protein [Salmonella enterica]|uniref:Conjugal transfer protein n=1 Tax=Salmonella enterica subsp. enterica serovar Poona TaxID=436295 RepID=A0A5V6NLS6_SALET|nr:lytic transglycosylase domain-containing protein [Salmonella enterica]EAM4449024.1 conjugal transfer protein [Salmonella enterica subsp. enterica serovar Infantis]EAP3746021.1 conjugal transfer protein [Salmonella enterica subsp. enterica serovar Minnesota]EAP4147432.1 conjugal transfer protein [Salmonella enterica subsp. enterica serovar Anatum]EAS6892538.1 conjugal transfer protein [Salmonella enterica subsp. enterica serovar Poona]EBH8631202.1 conjugal transfer protein [Salmonella enteri
MPAITYEIQTCVQAAAHRYNLPVKLILAVIKTEGGANGLVKHNKNGSVDLGIMQINSIHLRTLKKFGIGYNDILFRTCTNIEVGTWILRRQFSDVTDYRDSEQWWRAVGNYHSHTLRHNLAYQKKVWLHLSTLQE